MVVNEYEASRRRSRRNFQGARLPVGTLSRSTELSVLKPRFLYIGVSGISSIVNVDLGTDGRALQATKAYAARIIQPTDTSLRIDNCQYFLNKYPHRFHVYRHCSRLDVIATLMLYGLTEPMVFRGEKPGETQVSLLACVMN